MKNKIYILHEYGERKHYKALEYLAEKKDIKLEYYEFAISKLLFKSIIKRDFKKIKKQFKNISFLINLLFSRDKKVLLAIAPYDFRLFFLEKILKKHFVYYHTSWVYWDGDNYPKKLFVFNFIKKIWKDFLEKKVKHIFVVSNATKDSLLKNYNIEKSKINVVYHSFDDKIFFYKNREINKKCIFVGRLVKEKGIEELLDFFSKNNYVFYIAGKGPLIDKVKEFEKKYSNIKYLGFLNEKQLAEIFNKVTFLVLNSKKTSFWEELFGMVIIEAMACGVIPIATNHLGPKEIIDSEINGFLFKENELFQNLPKVLNLDEKKLSDLRKNAIKKSKNFCIEEISKRWESLFEK